MNESARHPLTAAHPGNITGRARRLAGDGAASASSRRALVIDDDELARRVLGRILQKHGYQVLTADDGLAGLRTLVDEVLDLDVVVTDVRMPGIGGEELIRRIREAGGERDLGIVVVTGLPSDRARLRAIGADAVIGKADGLDAIAAAVDLAALRAARARAPLAVEEP